MDDMKPKRFPTGAILIIIGVAVLIIGIIAWNVVGTKDFYKGVDINESYNADGVSRLDIELGVGTTKIEAYDGAQITVEGKNVPQDAYEFDCSGDTFTMRYRDFKWYEWYKQPFGFYYNGSGDNSMELTIYIPRKEYDKIKFEGGVGEYTLDGISCKEADCDFGVGTGKIENMTVTGKTDIDAGVGEVRMVNCSLCVTDIDCGVGEVDFSGRINGALDIDGGVGECNFKIDGYRDEYDIDSDSGIGDVSISGSKTPSGSVGKRIPIKVSCGVGEVNLTFK